MTTTVLLVRHASHDRLGRVLCGRMEGVSLSAAGLAEAVRLAAGLRAERPAAVYSSPAGRARQTAEPIAVACGLPVLVDAGLDEIEFGEWTGAAFSDLAGDPRWQAWNERRAANRPPGGESMQEVQARLADWLRRVRRNHPGATVVAVSHADVIKAAVMAVLGLGADAHDAFEIGPASITRVAAGDWGARLHAMNEAAHERDGP